MGHWINENADGVSAFAALVSATASAVIAWLTCSLGRFTRSQAQWTEEAAKISAALRDIELHRDSAEGPRVFIWFDGYDPRTGSASFVMQNSGKKSLFLRSLSLRASGMEIEQFEMDSGPKRNTSLVPINEIRDLVITPERIAKFYFKFKNGHGQHFDLLAQLYVGPPTQISIDPARLNGYELRADNPTALVAHRH